MTETFTPEQVAQHSKPDDLWVIYRGQVYDVTHFAGDHPGGAEVIFKRGGSDMKTAFDTTHEHSQAAHKILESHLVGYVSLGEESAKPNDLSPKQLAQMGGIHFNFDRAILRQIYRSGISKEQYLKFIHTPRHFNKSVRLFESDFLEFFSLTPWFVIPIVWLPVCIMLFYTGLQGLSLMNALLYAVGGILAWTLLEYSIHRFLFHIDDMLPAHPVALVLHFLLHGVHHLFPMDRYVWFNFR